MQSPDKFADTVFLHCPQCNTHHIGHREDHGIIVDQKV